MKKGFVFILALLFCSIGLYAQTFKAKINRDLVEQNETFEIEYLLEQKSSDFKAPNFSPFAIVSGPNKSESYLWVNGKSKTTTRISFVLKATKEGSYKFEPAYININGKPYASNTISINVKKSEKTGADQSKQDKSLSKYLFIKPRINRTDVYEGEPVIAEYSLYVLPGLSFEIASSPTFSAMDGVWAEEYDKINNVTYYNDGEYNAAVLKKAVFIPQRSGNFKIPSLKMRSIVRIAEKKESKSDIDDFFSDIDLRRFRDVNYDLESQPIEITARPLPQGAPKSYNGAVGVLEANIALDKSKASIGEPIILKITVSGSGNFPFISINKLNLPDGLKTYDAKSKDNYSASAMGISGEKIFEIPIVADKEGDYNIGSIEFSWFDTKSGEYKTKKSNEIKISVSKNSANPLNAFNSGNGADWKDYLLIIMSIAIIGVCAAALFYWLKFKKNKSNKPIDKDDSDLSDNYYISKPQTKNEIISETHIQSETINSDNLEYRAQQLEKEIWNFFKQKFNLSQFAITKELIEEKALESNIEIFKLNRVFWALDQLEKYRFGFEKLDENAFNFVLKETKKALHEIEIEFKNFNKK